MDKYASMDKYAPEPPKELIALEFGGIFLDIGEKKLDGLLDEGFLKELPLCSLLLATVKTTRNLFDWNRRRKTAAFIRAFQEKSLSREALDRYRRRLLANPKYAEEEAGRVLLLLERTIEVQKSELLGRFYWALVAERISWETFCELTDVTDRLFLSDLSLLDGVYAGRVSDTAECGPFRADRLISLGLLNSAMKSLPVGKPDGVPVRFLLETPLGRDFYTWSR